MEIAPPLWIHDEKGTAAPFAEINLTTSVAPQLTRLALERSEAKRVAFRYEYGTQYTAEQTVFVDESSFDRRTSIWGKAWALSGERAQRKCFFVRGRRYRVSPHFSPLLIVFNRYSLLPALAIDSVIHVKIVEGSFTTVLFHEFIEGLLDQMQPFPHPKSVIVMDNARIHKDPEIRELIEARWVTSIFFWLKLTLEPIGARVSCICHHIPRISTQLSSLSLPSRPTCDAPEN